MQFKILLFLFLFSTSCFGQDNREISKIDTLLPFFGKLPIRLHGYENRVVSYGSEEPLYVLTTYKESKNKNFEYFKIDSSKYLVYEFFRSDKGSSNGGLKSSGKVEIINKIVDSSTTGVRGIRKSTKEIHYYKEFSKVGTWFEYQDSLFYHRFWTGKYSNNRKVGIWQNYIYDPNENKLVMEINFNSDSSIKFYSVNIVETLQIDSINYLLLGRWGISCEDDKDWRIFITRCPLYDGQFSGDCNGMLGKESYYEF